MFKNKDGSYNKIQIFLISLIFIISISISGIYIIDNIELPEITLPNIPLLSTDNTTNQTINQSDQYLTQTTGETYRQYVYINYSQPNDSLLNHSYLTLNYSSDNDKFTKVYRSALYFNTSNIPVDAYIINSSLSSYGLINITPNSSINSHYNTSLYSEWNNSTTFSTHNVTYYYVVGSGGGGRSVNISLDGQELIIRNNIIMNLHHDNSLITQPTQNYIINELINQTLSIYSQTYQQYSGILIICILLSLLIIFYFRGISLYPIYILIAIMSFIFLHNVIISSLCFTLAFGSLLFKHTKDNL